MFKVARVFCGSALVAAAAFASMPASAAPAITGSAMDTQIRPWAKMDTQIRPWAKMDTQIRPWAKMDTQIRPWAKMDTQIRPW